MEPARRAVNRTRRPSESIRVETPSGVE